MSNLTWCEAMTDIFISYASGDQARVESLAKALGDLGWSVFWDFTIPVGKTWHQFVTEALDAAKCAVVVWSKTSINSDWVYEEAEEAMERRILVPALIDKVKPPLGFRRMQASKLINWTGETSHPEFEKLLDSIEGILGPSPVRIEKAERKRKQEEERKRKAEAEERKRKETAAAEERAKKAETERKVREAEEKRRLAIKQKLDVDAGTAKKEIKAKPVEKKPPVTSPGISHIKRPVSIISAAALVVCLGLVGWFLYPKAQNLGPAPLPKPVVQTPSKKTTFIDIGTGDIRGTYYPTGGAIARLVNKKRKEYGLRATVISTGGSVFNINAIIAGQLDFGIAQSVRQYEAWHGISAWRDKGPQKELRAVFSIHQESVTLMAAVDANINSIQDLRGRRVNIGSIGSGYRQNAVDALEANGLDYKMDFHGESIEATDAVGFLQDGRIDATFNTVAHPSGYCSEATSGKRKVKFIPISNIEKLLEKYPYYDRAVIPMVLYPGAAKDGDVETFGVKATLVTSIRIPEEVVYVITKEVFDNLQDFKKLHPAYINLTKKNMLEGLSAPLHPGAVKYYREAGLM